MQPESAIVATTTKRSTARSPSSTITLGIGVVLEDLAPPLIVCGAENAPRPVGVPVLPAIDRLALQLVEPVQAVRPLQAAGWAHGEVSEDLATSVRCKDRAPVVDP